MTFRHLLESEKIAIYAVLLHHSTNGKFRYGDLKQQASLYNVAERTIQRVWAQGQANQKREAWNAFTNVPAVSLDNMFYTLQSVMECILETGGSNKYKLQHIGKEAKRRRGELEESLTCSADTYLAARLVDL
ncbi:hypothetical protein DYB32_008155 [Aphanomyces invadans]|uniref:DUF7769 domain-containing protein n=1 Tax=Aphanomyces invadans TaxID=157072 RepID=A0A3R6VSH7_9STRA|nr:hypothetical protein DYB32_008155 [Aphanomyces invadans]